MKKKVTINFDSIIFHCRIELNHKDNIDQGFKTDSVTLDHDLSYRDFTHVLDQDKLVKLIYEQLKN